MNTMKRTLERTLLCVAGGYNILMAAITLLVYAGWFRSQGYALLENKGMLAQGATDVNNVAYVAEFYGLIVAIVGVASIIVSARGMRPATIVRGVMIWIGVCVAFSLLTRDWLGLILYSLCLTAYWARNKAIKVYGSRPTAS